MKPQIIINLKTYEQSTGKNALAIAEAVKKVQPDFDCDIILCPQMVDLRLVAETGVPCFAQTMDFVGYGSHTGHNLPEALKEAGAIGTLVNHAECQKELEEIEHLVTKANELGMVTVICAKNAEMAEQVALFNPDFVAMEPPELIGGDVSVSKAQPELITETVNAVKGAAPKVVVLTGAGVKTGEDLKIALELGTEGVLLASGICKAENPEAALRELLSGL